jgi:16S rRNA (guanine527-N7)-methyltransferase
LELQEAQAYAFRGLDGMAKGQLAILGDIIVQAGFNVTAVTQPHEIERVHFLDSLSLLDLECITGANCLADLGSGAGLPALVLAIALPSLRVVAVESQRRKCDHIERAREALSLDNVEVRCSRAEDYGRGQGRRAHDVVVSRALAALPVLAELSAPLLVRGGTMVAMKGFVSDQERIHADSALGILGCGPLETVRLRSFPGALNRLAYVAQKIGPTPDCYPRRSGIPQKRPLGA